MFSISDKLLELPSSEPRTEKNSNVIVLNNGRYVSLLDLGHGHGIQAKVYLAKNISNNNTDLVALKQNRDYHKSELTASAILKHENIIRFLDYGEHECEYYIVMEVGDCILTTLVHLWITEKTEISNKHIAFILKEILNAFIYIRNESLLQHADFNTKNVLYFLKDGKLKLIDFQEIRSKDPAESLYSIGELAHEVLSRLDHHCPDPYFSCDKECQETNEGAKQTSNDKQYIKEIEILKDLNPTIKKAILSFLNNKYCASELEIFMEWLSENIEELPKPKALVKFEKSIQDTPHFPERFTHGAV